MKKITKTNAMRLLDTKKLDYQVHTYEHNGNEAVDGVHVAEILGQDENCVFKTLVTQANTKEYIVFMLPVAKELDLKKCAKAAGVKSVDMIHVKDLLSITGYIRGGCSPLGMKKTYRTFIDESCLQQEHIFFSGGKIGLQIEMKTTDFLNHYPVNYAELTK